MLPKKGRLLVFLLSLLLPAGVVYAGDAPGLISPSNTSTTTSSKIEWQTPIYALYTSNPYRVQIDNNSDFSSLEKDYYTNNTSYTPTLSEGTWYWKVKSKDQGGTWSEWSENWSFTLTSATPTPSASATPTNSTNPTSSVFEVSSLSSSINSDQSTSTNVQITGLSPNTKYYLKGAFFKKDSTNYFGYTKYNNEWIKNSANYSSQYSFTSDSSGSFNTTLEVKPDPDDSGLSGSGSYQFKVGRYNSSGSGPTWSNEQSLTITVISSTSTSSTKSSSPTPTPTPTPTNKTTSSKLSSTSKNSPSSVIHTIPSLTPDDKVKGESIKNNIEIKSDRRSSINWRFIIAGFIAVILGSGTFIVVKKDLLFKLWKF